MDAEMKFIELFKRFIEQYRLGPEIAQGLLARILQILAEGTGDNTLPSQENEVDDK